MEPLWVLFAVGGLIFWLLVIAASVAIIASIENDSPGFATTTVVATFLVLWFFSDFKYSCRSYPDWRWAVVYLVGYIAIGFLWSFFKWYAHSLKRRERYLEVVANYRKQKGLPETFVPTKRDEGFVEYLRERNVYEFLDAYRKVQVLPHPNKPRNIAHAAYWPWSMLWTILDDFVYELMNFIYNHVVGIYHGISRHVFRGLDVE